MKTKKITYLLFILLFALPAAYAAQPDHSAYLDGGDSKIGLILCHGRGHHATWKVVEPLRNGVHEKLGYHTLSLQMPADDKNWKEYKEDFPQAYQNIRDGIDFLTKEKGVQTIYLMGHSMGSRMASAYTGYHEDHGISALIVAGLYNNGPIPLSGFKSIRNVTIPVLDIYGDDTVKDVKGAANRAGLVSDSYKQLAISGADHTFDGSEDEFVEAVVEWLKSIK